MTEGTREMSVSTPTDGGSGIGAGSVPGEVIRIEGLIKEFGSVRALDDVHLSIRENEFFALLGPSGCGKTTLLRCLGGFEQVSSGRILLDGRDLVGTKPYDRPVNMMFQSYALFPHMRVWDNVAYGLKMERRPKDEIAERVTEVLGKVGLEDFADRRPNQLSGGQRQRVALARAIVKRPRVLLLDEPLAALDRKMRGEMQLELKRLQHEVGITFIVVTHDQEEAMTMADRIAVMSHGRVLQVATPEELYDDPVDHFVAAFIGKMNFLEGTIVAEGVRTPSHGLLRGAVPTELRGRAGSLAVRPESVRILDTGEAPGTGDNAVQGIVESVAFVGSQAHTHLVLEPDGMPFTVTAQRRSASAPVGSRVTLAWPAERSRVLPS